MCQVWNTMGTERIVDNILNKTNLFFKLSFLHVNTIKPIIVLLEMEFSSATPHRVYRFFFVDKTSQHSVGSIL